MKNVPPSMAFTIGFTGVGLLAGCGPDMGASGRSAGAALEVGISFDESLGESPLDGRLLLILATDDAQEPRFQVTASLDAPQVFGIDVEGMRPGAEAVIDGDTFGFPHESLAGVPPGEYVVQAVLHRYETFHLANGKTVKLPMPTRSS